METIGTRDAVEAVHNVNLLSITPVQSVAEQDATYGPDLFARNPDQCCALRKVAPLNQALAGYRAWATGLRRADSPASPHASTRTATRSSGASTTSTSAASTGRSCWSTCWPA